MMKKTEISDIFLDELIITLCDAVNFAAYQNVSLSSSYLQGLQKGIIIDFFELMKMEEMKKYFLITDALTPSYQEFIQKNPIEELKKEFFNYKKRENNE